MSGVNGLRGSAIVPSFASECSTFFSPTVTCNSLPCSHCEVSHPPRSAQARYAQAPRSFRADSSQNPIRVSQTVSSHPEVMPRLLTFSLVPAGNLPSAQLSVTVPSGCWTRPVFTLGVPSRSSSTTDTSEFGALAGTSRRSVSWPSDLFCVNLRFELFSPENGRFADAVREPV